MNRKTILVLLCVSCLSILTGCPTAKPTVTETIASIAPEETTSPLVDMETQDVTGSGPSNENIPSSTDNAEEDYANNCMLFVNDIEIEDTHYVRMDQQAHDLELPLTEILKVLGADVRWEDSGIVVVSYKEHVRCLDTNLKDFGEPPPPGTKNVVRKVVDDDLVVDWETAKYVLRDMMEAWILVDFRISAIYIDKEDDYANNCRLIVNGIEIGDEHYVKIDHQEDHLELPLTEILKVLGADVRWEDSGIVVVSYMDKTVRYDPNMWDFDLPFPPGTINGVRKVINGDLVVEWDTASNVLRGLMGATISVDHDGSVIYIDSRR